MGSRHSEGQRAKVRCGRGIQSVGIFTHGCVNRLLVSGQWRALRQRATILNWLSLRRSHSWLCFLWEQCPEVMSGLTQAVCLSTAVCGGVLSMKILIEMSQEECKDRT